ncbi:alpha/beta fold hydrolase [Amycolatopsis sp. PS_44_ISF1]|uniref:alpha/beta fold hydrolase n=1 Tax=Amycolatopsis sp. PS_44_ISF1 TaxID=2974917 RepID=UPI0028DE360A|nr:alpha/beta fold hydrolase [Amycolatopsis sp. PS_44_ISF1]MDT8911022.1 alpha/beta hydrolase [Amycolatopsis sp. PS_44_ISF1]
MRTSRAGLVALAAAVVAASVPATASAADDPLAPYTSQPVTWGSCAFKTADGAKPSQCAQITVPRDWADPAAGVDLKVSISRAAATGEREGALLVNPGGPGGQGTSLAGILAGLEPSVGQTYDLIGMDPRGTGQEGSPDKGFQCNVPTGRLPQTPLDARDRSAQSIALHQQTPRAIAEACQSDALAPYITTWQTTHDMDLIRSLLGDEKLNYLGYSYGTWLGAKYASMFPDHVGKIVLDSSVNFQGRLQADFEAFPVIDQRQTDDVYLPWLSRQFPDQLGRTPAQVRQKVERIRDYYRTNGISPDNFDHFFVGNGSALQWLLGALLLKLGADALDGTASPAPAALADRLDAQSRTTFGVPAAELTVAKVVAGLPAPDYSQVPGTRFSVACGDQPTRSASWYKRLSDRQGPVDPIYGWAYGITEPCGYWSEAPQHELPNLPAQVRANVLVVQGEFDPQTGYEQAKSGARSAGVPLVSVDDSPFHGQYALSGNPCVDGLVNVFLTKNSRPGATTCPGVPLVGEHQVYPVAGPVGGASHSLAVAPAPDRLSALRESTQDKVSRLNEQR